MKRQTEFLLTAHKNHMQPNERAVIVFNRQFHRKNREFQKITNDTLTGKNSFLVHVFSHFVGYNMALNDNVSHRTN